jgi:hypothetical protein
MRARHLTFNRPTPFLSSLLPVHNETHTWCVSSVRLALFSKDHHFQQLERRGRRSIFHAVLRHKTGRNRDHRHALNQEASFQPTLSFQQEQEQ